ncbi:Rap1a/Tai family immunity protein [Methylobacterium brachythecii]|uniref:Rap1a immunity protein domain-containing protein n=1 Tax=Methylobacterium brachythecii TaxID=1176177 RepID=A0A7W6AIG1_9HYPH|nr:Rap1a/Tai family immunity protein [Methylobacterium brachythecii]MBB3903955.1 hypothetical protein [Methylobacterium brachythecii]GLS42701.1 hypothetical protein GCM10007884_06860 [Methylobacterium brachythecii]
MNGKFDTRWIAAAAAILVASSGSLGSVRAEGLTAGRLYDICHDRTSADWDRIGQWLCPSYLRGIVDGARLQAFHVTGSMETYKRVMQFCEPAGSTYDAAIGVVVKFIEARPETRPLSAAGVAYEAFSAEWPCPSERR